MHELKKLCQKYYSEKNFDNLSKMFENFVDLRQLSKHVEGADDAYKETERFL